MTSLTDKIVTTLSEQIRRGSLRPGDRLPSELALMEQESVSRPVVREAISRLRAARLVDTRHGIGTFVAKANVGEMLQLSPQPDPSSMLDVMAILEFRTDVESAAAALAAIRRGDEHLTGMETALKLFENGVTCGSTDVLAHDLEFHAQIARASGNRYFVDVLGQLGRTVSPRTRLGSAEIAELDHADRMKEVLNEHQSIYRAILRRDPDDARAAMRVHLGNSRKRLTQAYELTAGRTSKVFGSIDRGI